MLFELLTHSHCSIKKLNPALNDLTHVDEILKSLVNHISYLHLVNGVSGRDTVLIGCVSVCLCVCAQWTG